MSTHREGQSEESRETPRFRADELYAEFLRKRAEEGSVDIDAFCALHPEFETAIRILHSAGQPEGPPETVGGSMERLIRRKLAGEPALRDPEDIATASAGERYTIRREVARGGMGVIYEVWDETLGRPLAMKVIQSRGGLSRFLGEARITGRLDHPGVVPVHELGVDGEGRAYFTMSLVGGNDLEALFRKARTGEDGWTLTRVVDVLVRVCDTLAYAHSRGVIHRDLKPANIMVGPFGETYVMDWGLAKIRGAEGDRSTGESSPDPSAETGEPASDTPLVTAVGTVLGTPAYMPPEQATGDSEAVDERSDVYSVGAMLYSLLTGRMPYVEPGTKKSSREIVDAVIHGPPEPVLEIDRDAPPELVAICERAMQRDPDSRYATMGSLGEELRAYRENRVVRAYRTGVVAEFRKWVSRNRALASTIMTSCLLAIAGLAAFVVWQELARQELAIERDERDEALTARTEALRAKTDALSERELALSQKERALRRAEGLRISAQSAAALETDPGLALLLATEGARRAPGLLANNALYDALATIREERTLIGHADRLTTAAFSPDGRLVLTAARSATWRLWDASSGEELVRGAGHSHWVYAGFSPDGHKVLTWSLDGTAAIWDALTGRRLLELDGHDGTVEHAAFDPRGERVVTVSSDGTARIWSAESGELIAKLVGHTGLIVHGCFSPDGRRVATASRDGTARVWDAASGAELRSLRGHRGWASHVAFSPDGDRVVTASVDETVRLWSSATGEELDVLDEHTGRVFMAVFSPDGERILSASADGTARIWKPRPNRQVTVLRGHTDSVESATFSPDGERIVTASFDRTARIWETARGRELAVLRGHQSWVHDARFSSDGRRVVTASNDETARIWNAVTDDELAVLSRPLDWGSLSEYSPDGSRVVVWGHGQSAEIRSASSGELLATLDGHTGSIRTARFSPNGLRVITASYDFTARIWDTLSGRELKVLQPHGGWLEFAGFSPDGALAVTGARDLSARIWDAETGTLLRELKGHRHPIRDIAFSPDGERLATASDDETARIWDTRTGDPLQVLAHSEWVYAVAFSSGGRLLLTASRDNRLQVWDAHRGGAPLARLEGFQGALIASCFDREGEHLLTLHRDGTARLWRIGTATEVATVKARAGIFRAAGFGADGETFQTISTAGVARSWPLDPLPVALARRPRELTPADRESGSIGSDAERKEHRILRDLAAMRRTLAMAEKAWTAAPEQRTVHFAHARRVASEALSLLETSRSEGRRLDVDTELAKGVRLVERALRLPGARSGLESRADALRLGMRPLLPTCDAVDLALRTSDRRHPVPPGAEWRFFRGRAEPSAGLDWTGRDFDDGTWERGASGFGYGYRNLKTVVDDMRSAYTTLYLRHRFVIRSPERWTRFRLSVQADDGFVAYFNGTEICRVRAGARGERRPFDAVSGAAADEPLQWETVSIDAALVRRGKNVLAIQGLNVAADSSDFALIPVIVGRVGPNTARDARLLREFREVAASDDAPRLLYVEGRLLEREGRYAEAAAKLSRLRELDSTSAHATCHLAECLRKTGDRRTADDLLRDFIEASPDVPTDDLLALKEAALDVLDAPDLDMVEYLRAFLWARRNHRLAVRTPETLTRVGMGLYRLGLYEDAARTLALSRMANMAKRWGKEYPRDLAYLAMAYQRLGRESEAGELVGRLRELTSESADERGSSFIEEARRMVEPRRLGRRGERSETREK